MRPEWGMPTGKLGTELWVSVPNGPSMSVLPSEIHAWLMYLRFAGAKSKWITWGES